MTAKATAWLALWLLVPLPVRADAQTASAALRIDEVLHPRGGLPCRVGEIAVDLLRRRCPWCNGFIRCQAFRGGRE